MFLLAPLFSMLVASDPLPPPGGFDYRIRRDLDVTWSDGYRTRLDAYVPNTAPPAGGWPTVLCLHGGGGSRKNQKIRPRCKALAGAGYLAFAYDTRGQGETVALNLGLGLPESTEDQIRDVAESFAWIQQWAGAGNVDPSRLAVAGISNGGRTAYVSASLSGLPLPLPGPVVTHMPPLAAVAGQVFPLDYAQEFVPDGNRMQARAALNRVQRGEPIDEVQAILAEDFALLRSLVEADPMLDFLPALQQSTVPTLVIHSWDDGANRIHSTVEALQTLNPGMPHRFLVSTGVHGTPENEMERELMNESIRQWFDMHLKGRAPMPAHDDRVEVVINPNDLGTYLDEQSAWPHRTYNRWPPASFTRSMYLRQGSVLADDPPRNVETGPTVEHRVDAGYDVVDFFQANAKPDNVLGNGIQHSPQVFVTPATPDAIQVLGSPTLEVEVDSDSGSFQLHAAIYDVSAAGTRYVAGGTTAVYDQLPGRHMLSIEIQDMAYIFEAGHQLLLQLENVALRQPPGQSPSFYEVPYFNDSDVTLVIDPNRPPRLDLPVTLPVGLATPRITTASVASGATVGFDLDAGSARAGRAFFTVWNSCADSFLNAVTGPQLGTLGWVGHLDGSGRASLDLELDRTHTSLAGMRWTFHMGGFGPLAPWRAGPVEVILWP